MRTMAREVGEAKEDWVLCSETWQRRAWYAVLFALIFALSAEVSIGAVLVLQKRDVHSSPMSAHGEDLSSNQSVEGVGTSGERVGASTQQVGVSTPEIGEGSGTSGGQKRTSPFGLRRGLEKYLITYRSEERLRTGREDAQCPIVLRYDLGLFERQQVLCDNWDLDKFEFVAPGLMHQRHRLLRFLRHCFATTDAAKRSAVCVIGPACLPGMHNYVPGLRRINQNYRGGHFVRMAWTDFYDFDAYAKRLGVVIVVLAHNESVAEAVWKGCGTVWEDISEKERRSRAPSQFLVNNKELKRVSEVEDHELPLTAQITKAAAAAVDAMGGVGSFGGLHIRRGDKLDLDAFRCHDNFTRPERVVKLAKMAIVDSFGEGPPMKMGLFVATNADPSYTAQLRTRAHPVKIYTGTDFLELWDRFVKLENNYMLMQLEWAMLSAAKFTIRTYPDTFEVGEKLHNDHKYLSLAPYQKTPPLCPEKPDRKVSTMTLEESLAATDDDKRFCRSFCDLARLPVEELFRDWTPDVSFAHGKPLQVVWNKKGATRN